MTATPTVPNGTTGMFQKVVIILQDSNGVDYNVGNPIPTKVVSLG